MVEQWRERGARGGSPWRRAAWSLAGLMLLLPLIAMQFTREVNWTLSDFIFAAFLLGSVGFSYELTVKKSSNTAFRAAAGVALGAAFLLIWINAAVGIIGSEDNEANLMYHAVLFVGILSSLWARFRARGMARALLITALAHTSVALIALIAGLGSPATGPLETLALNGFFIGLWLASAWLFRQAAEGPS